MAQVIDIAKINSGLDHKRRKASLMVAAEAALAELPTVGELAPISVAVDDSLSVHWKYGFAATADEAESAVQVTVLFDGDGIDAHTRATLQQECKEMFTERLQAFMAAGMVSAQLAVEQGAADGS